jgi:hypothetical protein
MWVSGWINAVPYHEAAPSISQDVTDLLFGKCAITVSIDTQIRCLEHIYIICIRCKHCLFTNAGTT